MICFAWSEFPQYAARCVGAYVASSKETVVVVATKPRVPIGGMNRYAKCRVIWVSANDDRNLKEICGEMPRALIVSGWSVPAFNRFRDNVRSTGGMVVAMSDNNCCLTLKTMLRSIRFRLVLRGKYDGFIVPGKSGVELMRLFGVPDHKIRTGMYSADGSIFRSRKKITDRDKKMIYVGQLIHRKNVLRMCEAFHNSNNGEWRLDLYGCGPLKAPIHQLGYHDVAVFDFLQPEELAVKYSEARCFCLPSIEEHWGLVVHEAALSGCCLLLSNTVGSVDDFIGSENGFTFPPNDIKSMASAFNRAMHMSDSAMLNAQNESMVLGKMIGVEQFIDGINYFVANDK